MSQGQGHKAGDIDVVIEREQPQSRAEDGKSESRVVQW